MANLNPEDITPEIPDNQELSELPENMNDPHFPHHRHHHHPKVHNMLLDYYPLGPWFWEHPHPHHCFHEFPYLSPVWRHHQHPVMPMPPMPPMPPVKPEGFPCVVDECFPHKDPHFLDKDNFLNEFVTEQDKMKAREALGIDHRVCNHYDLVNVREIDNFIFRGYLSYTETDAPQEMWTKVATIKGSGILHIAFIYSNGKIIDGVKSYETKVYTDTIHAEEDGMIYVEKEDEPIKVIGSDIYVKDASCFSEGYIQPLLKVGNLKVIIYEFPHPHPHKCNCNDDDCQCHKHAPYRVPSDMLGPTQLWNGVAGHKAAKTVWQKQIQRNFDDNGEVSLSILSGSDLDDYLNILFSI